MKGFPASAVDIGRLKDALEFCFTILLREAELGDSGILHSPKGSLGFAYRSLSPEALVTNRDGTTEIEPVGPVTLIEVET